MTERVQDGVSLCGDDGGKKKPSSSHKTVHDTTTFDGCQPGEPASTASTSANTVDETHLAEGNEGHQQSGVPSH